MGMYEEDAYRLEESMFRFENMIDTTPTISSIAQFMKLEIKLVGFKYMPFDLKRFCTIVLMKAVLWTNPTPRWSSFILTIALVDIPYCLMYRTIQVSQVCQI